MYVTIPETLASLATLKYLGYTDATADQILGSVDQLAISPTRMVEVDPNGEILFIDVATSYLRRGRKHDTWGDNDQPWYVWTTA